MSRVELSHSKEYFVKFTTIINCSSLLHAYFVFAGWACHDYRRCKTKLNQLCNCWQATTNWCILRGNGNYYFHFWTLLIPAISVCRILICMSYAKIFCSSYLALIFMSKIVQSTPTVIKWWCLFCHCKFTDDRHAIRSFLYT